MPVDFRAEFWIAFKYGLVGILNTLVFTGTTWLFSLTGIHYSLYTGIGYSVAIGFSFLMNLRFTFSRFPGKTFPRAVRFLITSLGLMLCVQGIQAVMIEGWKTPELAAVLTGMIFYTGTGFLINRLWTFR